MRTSNAGTGTRKQIMEEVMHEYKHRELHSGTGKKKAKSRKQAIAIAMSEARKHATDK